MRAAILVAALLVLGSVAVAPTASASSTCQTTFADPPAACVFVDTAIDYALCYYNTPPSQWLASCV